jgi:Tol biopolymer transport system component
VAPPAADLTELNYVVISPNGQQLLFSARSGTGPRQLWVRPLDSTDATPLPDTEDAIEPFWSPNSKSVAFGAQGKLKRLDLGSSKARILTDAARSNNGAWSSEGVIVFSPDYRSPLFKVSAEGGERTPLPDGRGGEHRYPAFLPDGRHFLSPAGGRLVAGSLDGRDWKEVLTGVSAAVYAPPGVLLYLRAGVVVAQPFDVNRLEVSGEPQSLGTTVTGDWASGTRLSVSTNGVLVIQNTPMFDYQLTWFDAAGKLLGPFSPARHDIWNSEVPRISPDGTRVVVERLAEKDATRSLWLSDPGRSTFDRLTLGSVFHQLPIWSSDGRSIISSGARTAGGGGGISVVPIGVGEERELVSGTLFPQDATPDGKWLIYAQRGETTRLDLWRLPLAHGKAAGEASVIANSPFEETQARVSANSQWIAYVSDTTGVNEVYVRSLDAGGEVGDAKRVTDGGGVQPVWSRDGRTLFYMNTTNGYRTAQLMKVAVTTNGTAITFGTPAPIFKASLFPLFHVGDEYDVAPDGRFLVGIATPDTRVPAAMVVLNWAETLKGLERR